MALSLLLDGFNIRPTNFPTYRTEPIQQDKPLGLSQLGTPVYSNLIIDSGQYQDWDGNDITFEGITLDDILISVTQNKNIISTVVQGRDSEINEYISDNSFSITILGAVSTKFSRVYPQEDVNKLIAIAKAKTSLKVTSPFLLLFGITDIIIKSYDFPQSEGIMNVQLFRFECISELPFEIRSSD
jgi:hypothetical protein